MKKLPIGNSRFSLVDDDDYSYYSQWKWHFCNGYASLYYKDSYIAGKKRKRLLLHRLINHTPHGYDTDHINQNRLDNRKNNLRTCTRSQNMMNRSSMRGKSKYKGLTWITRSKAWQVYIRHDGKNIYIGHYKNEIEAASAYDSAAKKYHAAFANTNLL